jgi:radical SAM-linked protein
VRFRLEGDLRFVSHLDLMRLFERSCRRAGLPLRFTTGFNPRAMVHLPVPHAVGVAGLDEPLLVDFAGPVDAEGPDGLVARLNADLPASVRVVSARPLADRERFRPEWVALRCVLPPSAPAIRPEAVAALADGTGPLTVRRPYDDGKRHKELDIRPFLLAAGVEDVAAEGEERTRQAVTLRLAVTDGGSARPDEVLALLGVAPDDVRRTEIVRTEVRIRSVFPGPAFTAPKNPRPPKGDPANPAAEVGVGTDPLTGPSFEVEPTAPTAETEETDEFADTDADADTHAETPAGGPTASPLC